MCAPVRGSGEGDAPCQHNMPSITLSRELSVPYQAPHYMRSFMPIDCRKIHTHGLGAARVTLTTDHEKTLSQFS